MKPTSFRNGGQTAKLTLTADIQLFIQIVDVLRIACLPVTKLVRKIFYPKYFSLIIYKGLAIVLFLCGIAGLTQHQPTLK
jgi:hypothetical protein